MFRQCSGLFT